jgi:hypothetical protein
MTVFGFGRDQLNKSVTGINHSFTVGLIETDVTAQVRSSAAGPPRRIRRHDRQL